MRPTSLISLALAAAVTVTAYDIPASLQTFYNGVKNGGCTSWLNGKHDQNDGYGKTGFGFCTDTPGVVYLSGPGMIGDMDVDCDGSSICGGDGSWQGQTAFDDELQNKGYGLESLEASLHTYVVLGTKDIAVDTLDGGPISPLSVVAVICNNQLHYAVFGDTNGEHSTGEASIGLAQACFPKEGLSGDVGHNAHDVLYIAFKGTDAVPGASGAKWKASNAAAFEASLKTIGDKMIAKVFGGGSTTTTKAATTTKATTTKKTTSTTKATATSTPNPSTCTWVGHCLGDLCTSGDDCDDPNTCISGVCAPDPALCEWEEHCEGTTCTSDDLCSDPYSCISGICTCEWAGHCAGAVCSGDEDCSDPWVCNNRICGVELD